MVEQENNESPDPTPSPPPAPGGVEPDAGPAREAPEEERIQGECEPGEPGEEAAPGDSPPPAGADVESAGEKPHLSLLPQGMAPARALEALLFSSTEALSLDRLEKATGLDRPQVKAALEELGRTLEEEGRPYSLAPVGRGWRLLTRPEFHPLIATLKGIKRQEGLSKAALETLAVVACRQPIMRAEIEDIRGVQCGPMLRALLERKLLRVAGRAQVPGRPLLYGTTRLFLDKFGLGDLKELPTLREFKAGKGA